MKNNGHERRRLRLLVTAVGGLVLIAATGCICININVGGSPQANHPPNVSGGPFVPVTALVKNQTQPGASQICNPAQLVQTGTYVELKPPDTQTPNTGDKGFQGYLVNNDTGTSIPNSSYVLYWFVHTQMNGCCTNVAGDPYRVGFKITSAARYPHRFTVYWRQGQPAPPVNTSIKLNGTWAN